MHSSGYASGTFHLKEFRWKDARFFDLFLSPDKFKKPLIKKFIELQPDRRFVLVGDSGEKDPEIYADMVKSFPKTDIRILIRELNEQPFTPERYRTVFESLPGKVWRIVKEKEFQDPSVVASLIKFIVE